MQGHENNTESASKLSVVRLLLVAMPRPVPKKCLSRVLKWSAGLALTV